MAWHFLLPFADIFQNYTKGHVIVSVGTECLWILSSLMSDLSATFKHVQT